MPVPVANFVASSSSLASCRRPAISVWSEPQSIPISMEKGTNACAFSVEMIGLPRVGALSVVSVASAA